MRHPRTGGTGRRTGRRDGFTLIELLVVIIVLGTLATLVAPNIFRHVGAAKETTARAQIEMLGAALDAYRLDAGRYPTTQQGLEALWTAPSADPRPLSWRGPYLRKAVPLDPWGRTYEYRSPGTATNGVQASQRALGVKGRARGLINDSAAAGQDR